MRVFVGVKEAYDSVSREELFNTAVTVEFVIPMKLVGLIEIYSSETYKAEKV
jgi:hypothetical protein